jgi:hypothetical protein
MISGVQVDAWGAFVPEQGKQIEKLRNGVVKAVEERGLSNLEISTGEMAVADNLIDSLVGEKREYTFFQQKLGKSANSTLALRIAPRGNDDLEISWRLLESNPQKTVIMGMSQGTAIVVGIWIALCIGIPLLPVDLPPKIGSKTSVRIGPNWRQTQWQNGRYFHRNRSS